MKFHFILGFALFPTFAATSPAHATPLATLDLNLIGNSFEVTGSITFSQIDGHIQSELMVATLAQSGSRYFFNPVADFSAGGVYSDILTDSAGDTLDLILPFTSLIGYDGGPVCSLATSCQASIQNRLLKVASSLDLVGKRPVYASSGTLTPTPEPASILLLGTGMLGIAAAALRQRQHS